MKKTLALFLFFVSGVCLGQNLVTNPSFENMIACPNSVDEVYKCADWSSYGNSPDYFNACDTFLVDVPSNLFGNQFAATGDAYSGLFNFSAFPSGREWLGSQLVDSLEANFKYYVSFKVSLADRQQYRCNSNKIGILFSTVPYNSISAPALNNFAHVFAQNIISDTTNWVLIKGSFVADSNYKYIVVGNFFDNAHTDTMNCNLLGGYFYIDDICVSTDSLTCNSTVGFAENNNTSSISIYPSPFNNLLNISLKNNQPSEITLYDITSRKLLQQTFTNSASINTQHLAPGIYFYVVLCKGKVIGKGKVVK